MPSTVNKEVVKSATPPLVELYTLDTGPITGWHSPQRERFYFTPMTQYVGPNAGTPESFVVFQGYTYTPFPIEATGWEYTLDGAPTKPSLKVSNVNRFLQAAVNNLGDLVGAKVIRRRTFMNFLDGMPDADASQQLPLDVYYIDQKVVHNKNMIEWSLINVIERANNQLPLRLILPELGFLGVGKLRIR